MPLGTEETGKLAGSVMVGRRDIIFAPQLERFCQLRAADWRISLIYTCINEASTGLNWIHYEECSKLDKLESLYHFDLLSTR